MMKNPKEKAAEIDFSTEYKSIGKRLKELRKKRGYKNYEHIAFDLGMSRSAYWRIESGANFEIKTLLKICKLLNITLEEFFSDEFVKALKSVDKK